MPTMTSSHHAASRETTHEPVAVLGLGYVGLPTALALMDAGTAVTGIDASASRLDAIRARDVDLLAHDHRRLEAALHLPNFRLTADAAALAEARTVLVCVPTPVDAGRRPDLGPLRAACEAVVARANPGQTIVLTSTSYVGTTRDLLVEPLRARGLEPGRDVFVAFSPERVDPGNAAHEQESVPRVLGAVTPACAEAAATVLWRIATMLHRVSSPEAAELTKLQENTFRAVNIALANELDEACHSFGLDPIEVTEAAATKPYGYMPFYPGAGVGGHCIPCDPHYLLAGGVDAPLIERAMRSIHERPARVAERAAELLGGDVGGRRVLVLGAAYKPGVRDVREAPALEVISLLRERGADVRYHDPLVPELAGGLRSEPDPGGAEWDLVVVCTVHPDADSGWLAGCPLVLDTTRRAR
ncbi:MAG: nucleotide sugar dehydrogenase [Thermoleophilaceae bacterium]